MNKVSVTSLTIFGGRRADRVDFLIKKIGRSVECRMNETKKYTRKTYHVAIFVV